MRRSRLDGGENESVLWKTMKQGLWSAHGTMHWDEGRWYAMEGPLVLCHRGFHASPRIIDAMAYVSPDMIAMVEVRGMSIQEGDKQCWSEMRVLQSWRWTAPDSVAMAVCAAELVLHLYTRVYRDDPRPTTAIEAAKSYLSAYGTEAAGAAAEEAWAAWAAASWVTDAAACAARAAAWAAEAAARAAAGAAAGAAAEAARAAAGAARAAAGAARAENILNQCESFIYARLHINEDGGDA